MLQIRTSAVDWPYIGVAAMLTVRDNQSWRAELKEILDVCKQRQVFQ